MMDALWVYVTVADRKEALKIGRTVVDERLAACANIPQGHTAIFRWSGRIEQAEEASLILKTTTGRFEALRQRVRDLSSYNNPCILALPVETGDHDFLDWIVEQVRPRE